PVEVPDLRKGAVSSPQRSRSATQRPRSAHRAHTRARSRGRRRGRSPRLRRAHVADPRAALHREAVDVGAPLGAAAAEVKTGDAAMRGGTLRACNRALESVNPMPSGPVPVVRHGRFLRANDRSTSPRMNVPTGWPAAASSTFRYSALVKVTI